MSTAFRNEEMGIVNRMIQQAAVHERLQQFALAAEELGLAKVVIEGWIIEIGVKTKYYKPTNGDDT